MLGKAIALASEAFKNKKDKGGKSYILHCLRVMHGVDQNDEELMCVAVLHDLIEDCPDDWNLVKLAQEGFTPRVLSAIALLTHNKEKMDYDTYIKGISTNPDATAVKLADLQDNSLLTRIKDVRKKDFDRIEKYHKAFIYLQNK